MAKLTHTTALVVIPSTEVWLPIQAIREKHDRKVRPWMPHITLVYPFVTRKQFGAVRPSLVDACIGFAAFDIQLSEFRTFRHRRDNYTIWLKPEHEELLIELQMALRQATHVIGGLTTSRPFQPHLSVGQVAGMRNMVNLVDELQAAWSPLHVTIAAVSMIWRADVPDDMFRVATDVPLVE